MVSSFDGFTVVASFDATVVGTSIAGPDVWATVAAGVLGGADVVRVSGSTSPAVDVNTSMVGAYVLPMSECVDGAVGSAVWRDGVEADISASTVSADISVGAESTAENGTARFTSVSFTEPGSSGPAPSQSSIDEAPRCEAHMQRELFGSTV